MYIEIKIYPDIQTIEDELKLSGRVFSIRQMRPEGYLSNLDLIAVMLEYMKLRLQRDLKDDLS